ncbi:YjjI family glycine radical enzyme [Clostridium grantii]|uniref:Glycine radical enzyme, YjjI family n=1 Tax=Clostridium grantii DSM 8605 TaxID=1121316 RepID=A0A1M5UQP2_9CLOT|nr:YjjI family glycine radical enzyme [Clostridium grantii]SHH65128.1 glycine radical enzyme, YjjI family [Clostridium grantii DSM 8605]
MSNVLNIIKNEKLTFEQRVISLAKEAENSLNVLNYSDEYVKLKNEGIICDLFEGNAPYRPRYIVPDYEKLMKQGCEFLKLAPPKDIWEATNTLLIFYKHVPSITTFPVYIGNIDKLLNPFIKNEKEAYQAIKLFLMHIDRTITDSFCHANIGPETNKAAILILQASSELETPIPNITLKYNKDTPDELAIESIKTALVTAKPSFANDEIFKSDLGEKYAIVSCYNGLYIGGGSYTLSRLNLAKLALSAKNIDDFMEDKLPNAVKTMCEYMDERIKFLIEETPFFNHNFLVKEGFISKERFTAMFGMVGLAEATNKLLNANDLKDKFGHSDVADNLGYKIIERLEEEVLKYDSPYCQVTNGKFVLHAQVGIDSDIGVSPGCRIPIGNEPEIHQHVIQSAKFHKFFPSGIGDVFNFDETAKKNPEFILDIIKGAFKQNMRYFSLYSSDCDVIRITGYLVKKSEIEKLKAGEAVLRDTTVLGLGAVENNRVGERKIRKND